MPHAADLLSVEHYFQNVKTGHKSPCAKEFVSVHKQELGGSSIAALVDPQFTQHRYRDGRQENQRGAIGCTVLRSHFKRWR